MRAEDYVSYYEPEVADSADLARVLYHYVPLKYGVSDLKNEHLKLSRPTELNDPLDSAGFYKGVPSKDSFFRWFADAYFKEQVEDYKKMGMCDLEIWRELGGFVAEAFSRYILSHHPLKDNLIASFCAGSDDLNTDVLLWSHYADNCRGIRIGYQIPDGYLFKIFKVNYAHQMPALNLSKLTRCDVASDSFNKMMHDYHRRMLCTKHTAWKYENEYRLITNVNDNENVVQHSKLYFVNMPVKLVRSIDFGCLAFGKEKMKADEHFLRTVWQLHKSTGLDLDLFRKAELQVGRYGYKYVPFSDVVRRFLRHYDNVKYRKAYLLRCPAWVREWRKSHCTRGSNHV